MSARLERLVVQRVRRASFLTAEFQRRGQHALGALDPDAIEDMEAQVRPSHFLVWVSETSAVAPVGQPRGDHTRSYAAIILPSLSRSHCTSAVRTRVVVPWPPLYHRAPLLPYFYFSWLVSGLWQCTVTLSEVLAVLMSME